MRWCGITGSLCRRQWGRMLPGCRRATLAAPRPPRAPQAGIPLLVLGNKNDLPEALPAAALIERLGMQGLKDREVCVYSISCKRQANIDVTLRWLQAHAK